VIRVCGKIDEEKVNDKLDDLDPGYPFFPPDTDATRSLEVVPVHDDVDSQIKGDWDVTLREIRWSCGKNLRQRYDPSIE
jgi:hypothetical protein